MNLRRLPLSGRTLGLLVVALAIGLGFGWGDPDFRDPFNLLDRSRHWVEIGLIAIPMTFIIASGGIDLSVGSLMALSGIVVGVCWRDLGWGLPWALAAGVAAGTLGGAFNGWVVGVLRVPALVVTLATLALYRGLALGLSHAAPISSFPEGFIDWGAMATLGMGDGQVPHQLLILLASVALGEWVFRKSRLGRWSVQIGESASAARFAAIPVARVTWVLYTLSGLVCALAAVLFVGRFATAMPSAGRGMELDVIAAVVIGGTRITGGSGSVLRSFLGVVIVGLLRFGMQMRGVEPEYQIVLVGLLVIVTAILNECGMFRMRNDCESVR